MSPETSIIGYCRACGKALQATEAVTVNGALYCAEHAPRTGAENAPSGQGYTQGFDASQAPASPPPLPGETSAQYTETQQTGPYYTGSHQTGSPYTAPPFPGASPYSAGPPPPLPGHHANSSPVVAFVLGFIPGVGAVYNGQYAKGLVHVVIFGSIISILSSGAARGFEPLFGLMIPTFILYMAFEAYHTAKKLREGEAVDEFSGMVRTGSRGRSRFPVAPVLLITFGVLFLLDNFDLLRIGRLLRYWPGLLIALGIYLLYDRITEIKTETRAETKYEPK